MFPVRRLARTRRRPRALPSAVLLAVLLAALVLPGLAGCTAAPVDVPAAASPSSTGVQDPEERSPAERYASGDLTLGDPAAAGYAPVTDVPDIPVTGAPSVVVPAPDAVLPSLTAVTHRRGAEVLSAVGRLDTAPAPSALPSVRDGARRNGLGELVGLDDPASTACGNVEIAVRTLDGDRTAVAQHLTRAAAAARASSLAPVRAWAEPLAAVDPAGEDVTVLVGFLSACTRGGYEL